MGVWNQSPADTEGHPYYGFGDSKVSHWIFSCMGFGTLHPHVVQESTAIDSTSEGDDPNNTSQSCISTTSQGIPEALLIVERERILSFAE